MKWRGLEESEAGRQTATLREELEQRKSLAEQYVPSEIQQVNRQTVEELRLSGIAERILAVDAQAPSFQLCDHDGARVSSADLLGQGRLVICFFRGRWCPFCVAQLEAMNAALPRIRSAGANFLAISPQTVKQSYFMHDQHKLAFPLLNDAGNVVARKFGLVYRVPEQQRQVYSRTFVNLPFLNGEPSWELPIPAIYILEADHKVVYAAADPDYTRRPEPEDILRRLSNRV